MQESYKLYGFCGPIKVFPQESDTEGKTVREIAQGYYKYAEILSRKYSISPPS